MKTKSLTMYIVVSILLVSGQTSLADNQVVVVPIAGELIRAIVGGRVIRDTPGRSNYEIIGETVLDRSTGLKWQRRRTSSAVRWEEALNYCESLITNGPRETSWRLPTIQELITLFRFGDDDLIEPTVFRDSDEAYWSSTYSSEDLAPGTGNPYTRWVAYFYTGHFEGLLGRSYSLDTSIDSHYVRCVR